MQKPPHPNDSTKHAFTARAACRAGHSFRVGAVAVEAKEATQRTSPGNSLADEQEAAEGDEAQGEAVMAMLGALQVLSPPPRLPPSYTGPIVCEDCWP